MCRHLDPDRRVVDAAQTQQVVGDGAFRREPFDEGDPRLRIDESRGVEWADLPIARFGRVAEHHFEIRVGRESSGLSWAEQTDVDAFVDRLEQPCEGVGAVLVQSYLPCNGGGVGVSLLGKRAR